MTTTAHEQGAHWAMQRFLQDVPVGGAVLAKMMDDLRSGHWPEWYVDAICQPSRAHAAGAWPMEQIYAFMFIDDWIQRGALAVIDIEVGEKPHRDSARAENQAALNKIDTPYVATVDEHQHCADDDGNLIWTEPIVMSFLAPPGDWNATDDTVWTDGVVTKDALVPLEIGSTLATKSLWHLAEGRSLARWPYGSTSIRLFLGTDRFTPYAKDRYGNIRPFTPPKPMGGSMLPRPEDLTKETTDGS